jgi:ribosomal protein S18 acetylase RimI-like enzyme
MIKLLDITDEQTATQVLEVQIPAYQVEADIIGYQEIPPLTDTIRTLQSCGEVFYGYFDPFLAGVVSYKIEHQMLDIHRVVVHPHFFRRGIGKAMVQFLLNTYKDKVDGFIVRTGKKNIPALKLYQQLGFREIEQVTIVEHLELVVFIALSKGL